MKFDFVIGNPPYQDPYKNSDGTDINTGSGANSIYNNFMDSAEKVADKVLLITPGRFLFNAGATPKEWNKKKLNDPHFKVIEYESNSNKFFPALNTPIKGGVAITYYDRTQNYEPIKVFIKYKELNSIIHKVSSKGETSLEKICVTSYAYKFTNKSHEDYPQMVELMSRGHSHDLTSNCMEVVNFLFHDELPVDGYDYIKILGRKNNQRIYKYVRREYINSVENLDKWKIFIPKATGTGEFGERFSEPVIGEIGLGSTETFMSIGLFSEAYEAENLNKYIKSKFCRLMLGVLKVTQDISPSKFKYVPIQDFTSSSDIDWSKSIKEIDQQLYKKYNLTNEEINFIETKVKEME